MNKLTKTSLKILLSITILLVVLWLLFYVIIIDSFKGNDSLPNGYSHAWGQSDNSFISKNGNIVVEATIVSFDSVGNLIVGLRLPTKNIICRNGDTPDMVILNRKEYFVLDSESNVVINFSSKKKFEEKIDELGISQNIILDYSMFDSVWKTYSSYYERDAEYYSNCVDEVET